MEQQSNIKSSLDSRSKKQIAEFKANNTIFLGTTTLSRMLSAAYNATDPLHTHWIYSECGVARMGVENGTRSGDEVVYLYYHREEDETIMTNIEGDIWGIAGSSAGFKGKVSLVKHIYCE